VNVTGRNDPCPCGSGKKYKKCCFDKDVIRSRKTRAASESFIPAERASVLAKLLSFACGSEFEVDREIAFRLFWGERLGNRSHREIQTIMELPQTEVNFNTWYLFDMDVEDGKTVTDFFLAQEGDRVSPGERAYLEKARRSHFRLYEVEEVETNQGLSLKDLWTGESIRVKERAGTRHFLQWDIMATRLMDVGHGARVIDGGIYNYPPRAKGYMLKSLRKEHKRLRRRLPDQDDAAFFKRFGILFNHWWLDWVAFPPAPRVVTVEGDDVSLTKSVFEVRDTGRLKEALERHTEFEKTEPGRYSWRKEVPDGFRSLGTLTVKGNRLILETMSKERAERGRALLEGIAGEVIQYLTRECQDLDQALKSRPKTKRPRPPEIPPEVQAKLLKQFYDKHYHEWLDEEIPALDYKTPRHSVTLKTYRPRVVDLLKDMENMEARGAKHGEPRYDFGWVWKELGLDREGET